MFEDHASTRIDLACPYCQQRFKVRLRKLLFGAELICRLCRHEFSAREVSDRPDVQEALARMHRIVSQRVRDVKPRMVLGATGEVDKARQEHRSAHMKGPSEPGGEAVE